MTDTWEGHVQHCREHIAHRRQQKCRTVDSYLHLQLGDLVKRTVKTSLKINKTVLEEIRVSCIWWLLINGNMNLAIKATVPGATHYLKYKTPSVSERF